MHFDLLVSGGTVVTEDGIRLADLAVQDGRVAALLPRNHGAQADRVMDASGCHVLPGCIDPHVHLNLGPGEARYQETATAPMGGVTTLIHMFQSTRPYEEIFEEERAMGEQEAYVDFSYHLVLLTPDHVKQIPRYVRDFKVSSFKHLMHIKGKEGNYLGIEEGTDDGLYYLMLKAIGQFPHTVLTVHNENIEIIWRLQEEVKATGREDLAAYSESRPGFVEANAVDTTMTLARAAGATVYMVHMSSKEGLDAYLRQRETWGQAYAETCPQYLTHTMDSELRSLAKVNPPLRTLADAEALWSGILDGSIDTIGSDHVPRRAERKQGSVWTSSAGYPGIATILPVMVSEGVHKRGLDWTRLVHLTSTHAARIFGLYPRKGSLRPGADADFVILDADREWTVNAADLGSYSDYSIYDGWTLKGKPLVTCLRGRPVMEDGALVGEAGYGRFLERGL